ncbi:sugar ABC transporter ATP-binding protein [Sphaerochaeta sp.]|uniref:sugar ABC transporter ATP-binding protein n=1 Tax=Sphaerochaeta sp. TaxID=1972642 RepID=UPI003D115C91
MARNMFLKMHHVSKTFPGVKALKDIDLEVDYGEIHALIGENGAGKSTLIKILSGVYQPDEGAEIIIDGELQKTITPLDSLKRGIAVIYQDFSLFPNLSVAENIAMVSRVEKRKRLVSWRETNQIARTALAKLGLEIPLSKTLSELSVAKQQLVAIARALVNDAKLIVMDEPTSALSRGEVEALFSIIRNLKEQGISILFISHKLDELFAISDRFSILRDGKYLGTFGEDELDDDRLISLMVGRKIEYKIYEKRTLHDPIFEVRNLSKAGNFKDISFTLNRGEILGITGLVGAGRSELAQAIFGLNPSDSGELVLDGKPLKINTPEQAVQHGISYIPENRLTEGLILKKTMSDNISLTVLNHISNKHGLIDKVARDKLVNTWIEEMNIRPNIPNMVASKLSGGNQQRVVLSKWLATDPKVLIVDEPTNGIDIGAKADIHQLLRNLSERGVSIIVISSELPEILAIGDRVLVMRRGKIVATLDGKNLTQEEIMKEAL